MRAALLSTLDRDPLPNEERAPFRRFAGSTLIQRQLDLALMGGCEAVFCSTSSVGVEVIELQRYAENRGVKFIVVRDAHMLGDLLPRDAELLVIAPGFFPDDETVLSRLDQLGVLVFPAKNAVQKGFERVDQTCAWSGVLLTTTAIARKTSTLPIDIDIPSAILRLSLQAGIEPKMLDEHLLDGGLWQAKPRQKDLSEREDYWIKSHVRLAPFAAPGLAFAERVGLKLVRDSHSAVVKKIPLVAAIVSGGLGLISSAMGAPIIGLAFGVAMTLFVGMTGVFEKIRSGGHKAATNTDPAKLVDWASEPVLIVLVASASTGGNEWLRLFVPTVLFGLMRLGRTVSYDEWRWSYADRIAASAILLPTAFFGSVQIAAALLAMVVLVSLFFSIKPGE